MTFVLACGRPSEEGDSQLTQRTRVPLLGCRALVEHGVDQPVLVAAQRVRHPALDLVTHQPIVGVPGRLRRQLLHGVVDLAVL